VFLPSNRRAEAILPGVLPAFVLIDHFQHSGKIIIQFAFILKKMVLGLRDFSKFI
jgi:hypothetical protein